MIKLIKSTFYKEEDTKKKLTDFINSSKILSFSAQCELFEKNFADYQGRKHCVFFNSGSTANFALIQSLKNLGLISEGDLAAFSAVTWSTNVMPLLQLGIKPIAVDVELDTLNVSSRNFMQLPLSTKLFFITNLLGFCDDIDKIEQICKDKGIILIEDNCESLGTVYKNKKLGNFGLASTFSFFVGHHMSTIEGGCVCTDNKELAQMLRMVRAHGWDRNLPEKEQKQVRKTNGSISNFYAKYTFYDLGNNFRPTEINGFLGNNQLEFIDEIIDKRNKNFMLFVYHVNAQPDRFYPLKYDHIDFLSNFAVPVICKSEEIKNKLLNKFDGLVEVRPIVGGDMTQQPFYRKYQSDQSQSIKLVNSKIIHNQGFYFGNNPELSGEEIANIIKLLST